MDGRPALEQHAKVFAALSDATRLQMIELLSAHGEMSGSDLADRLGISLALHCHHSKILCEAGVITKRREGQSSYCALNKAALKLAVRSVL